MITRRNLTHNILQCLDVVLGAMSFKLNQKHKRKPNDSYKRGKRTIAKENLYRHIYQLINSLCPKFNIGVSTGLREGRLSAWKMPYRHWEFKPKNFVFNPQK